ncbi:MAG TPA: UDP-glucose/GDP-mannose dehydrogenase family protein [Ilumatobacteraceae bacterium]|nr:UDP-glucose/GDP-mannose dehydrogenase family protein [Ilumatobacteraceae bacterium]
MAKIAVIGTGYVGLTTGACFARMGHHVVCADIDPVKVESLRNGVIPIFELGLQELVEEGLAGGRLSFVLGAATAAKDCDIAFLCVPTPQGEDGSADLSYIEAAASEIGPVLPYEAVVVNKSTVPVGSAKVVERVMHRPDVKVVSNPEFLREGSAVQDFLRPDRVVVGCDDQAAALKVSSLYEHISAPVIITDPASAETIKYAANAFLATKLSFINAIAAICEGVGADVNDVVVGMGSDKRIGQDFLRPGPGWGGSCFGKDTRALLKIANEAGYHFDLLDGVITVNEEQFDRVADKIRVAAGGDLSKATIAVWGLTFKARTDDLRDSPSLAIIERLLDAGATVQAHDPTVAGPKPGLPTGITIADSPYAACNGADVLAVLTEWDEFRWVDIAQVQSVMTGRAVVDARNLLERNEWRRAGFDHQGIGR